MNAIVALVLVVKAALVASVATLAFAVQPVQSPVVAPVDSVPNVEAPARLDVTGVNQLDCDAMGGRYVGNDVCEDVDY